MANIQDVVDYSRPKTAQDWANLGLNFIRESSSQLAEKFAPGGMRISNVVWNAALSAPDIGKAAAGGNLQEVTIQVSGFFGVVYGAQAGAALGSALGPKGSLIAAVVLGAIGGYYGEKVVEDIVKVVIDKNGLVSLKLLVNPAEFAKTKFGQDLLKYLNPAELMQCFPATTPILTPSGTTPIEHIRTGDTVLAFDPAADLGRGALVPARVTKLFRNTTQEWIALEDAASGGSLISTLICTPGHHFLDEHGNFPTIAELLIKGGGRARIVAEDGSLREMTGKRIVWTKATAHLFGGQVGMQVTGAQSVGNLALAAPAAIDAWATYNFEVEHLHTYVAGGVRVHNISAPWAHEQALADSVTAKMISNGIDADYAKQLGNATKGIDDDNRHDGVVDGYTSSGRNVPIDEKTFDENLEKYGGQYGATPLERAQAAAESVIERGGSRADAMAVFNNEVQKKGSGVSDIVAEQLLQQAMNRGKLEKDGPIGSGFGKPERRRPSPIRQWAASMNASHSFIHVTTGSNLAATDRLMKAAGAQTVGGAYVV